MRNHLLSLLVLPAVTLAEGSRVLRAAQSQQCLWWFGNDLAVAANRYPDIIPSETRTFSRERVVIERFPRKRESVKSAFRRLRPARCEDGDLESGEISHDLGVGAQFIIRADTQYADCLFTPTEKFVQGWIVAG